VYHHPRTCAKLTGFIPYPAMKSAQMRLVLSDPEHSVLSPPLIRATGGDNIQL